jgi:membrane fusion protein, epimerase transport system
MSTTTLSPHLADAVPPVDDDPRRPIIAGLVILGVFVGALGIWSAVAPVSSAVIAPAVVKVEGNRKSVQHLDGGIVKELRVKEGDKVEAGQALIVLDDTQALGAVGVLRKQHDDLRAQEARLLAERDGASTVSFPVALTGRRTDSDVDTLLRAQENMFVSRQTALAGQVSLLKQKVAQTREQIIGSKAVLTSREQQLDSTRGELTGLRDLFKKGYVPRQRMLELERSGAELEGQVGEVKANVARAYQTINEATLQIAQLQADRAAQVAGDLRDVQAKLAELGPKLKVAEDTLARTEIRAPYSGYVVGMTVFGVGGVIARGEKIMDIVPDTKALAVEATVNVEDIEGVHPGMEAQVRLTAYTQRSTPSLRAYITQVSADRLTDNRSGQSYYAVQAKVPAEELAKQENVKLFPGMPAMLVIPTGERTVLDYLLKPLTESINKAMREK